MQFDCEINKAPLRGLFLTGLDYYGSWYVIINGVSLRFFEAIASSYLLWLVFNADIDVGALFFYLVLVLLILNMID